MNMDAYTFSKYLLVLFSKHQKKVDGWREYENDFTNSVLNFASSYNNFKEKANNTLISNDTNYKGRDVEVEKAKKEIAVMKDLKTQWKKFCDEYNKIGNSFIQKYASKIHEEGFEQDQEALKEFLAEYNAFENLETHTYSLENFELLINKQIDMFEKSLSQGQPGDN